jgi:hypothetical protein
MDLGAAAPLLPKEIDRDLAELLAADFAIQGIEAELGRQAEHLVDSAEQPSVLLDVPLYDLDHLTEALRLLLERGQTSSDGLPLTRDGLTDMLGEDRRRHATTVRTDPDG